MTNSSLAQPEHPAHDGDLEHISSIVLRALSATYRAKRALALYVEHFDEIALSFRAGVYKVSSCTGAAVYTVRLRGPEAYCSCPDARGGECKHVAATQVCSEEDHAMWRGHS